jgi:hypothetical protein
MKKLLPIAVILLMLPLYADWGDHGLTLLSTAPSSMEEATKFELKDRQDRTFYVHARTEPDGATMKRILRYKDDLFTWRNVSFREVSFFMYEKGIQAVCVPYSAMYKDTNLMPYLPAGFTFSEEKEGMKFRFRIIVGSTSLKLDGPYSKEDPLLEEVYLYIKGIREGTIVVEDERVVSGSIVSFSQEMDKGSKHVYPVGNIPSIDQTEQEVQAEQVEREERQERVAQERREAGFPGFFASLRGTYLLPMNLMSDIFIGGYGFLASGGVRDLAISYDNQTLFHLELELSAGYWHLTQRDQADMSNSYSMNKAYVVPIHLTARSRFGIYKDFSLSPAVTFGYNYNSLDYTKLTMAGLPYSMSVRQWNPSLMLGFRGEYRFEKFFIFAGADFMAMFERRMTITSLIFSAGGGYIF